MKAYYNISHSYGARRKIRKKLQRTKGEHMKMLCAQTSELMRYIRGTSISRNDSSSTADWTLMLVVNSVTSGTYRPEAEEREHN